MGRLLIIIVFIGMGSMALVACGELTPAPTIDAITALTATLTPADLESPEPLSSPTPTATQEPTSNLVIREADIRNETLQFWHPWNGGQAETIEKLVESFNTNNEWGITVKINKAQDFDQLWNEIAIARQSGETPDIAIGYLHQILAADVIEPIVDLELFIQDPIWGLNAEEQADFYPEFWNADLVKNRRLGIPALPSAHLIFYNTTWANELGFENPPSSPEELAEQACAATQANLRDDNLENDGTGGSIISTHYNSTLGWLRAFGAPVINNDQSAYSFDESKTEEALRFLRKLYEDGCAWLPDSEFTEVEFAAREGLFRTGTLTGIPHQAMAFSRQENGDSWSVLAFPSPQGTPALPVYGPAYTLLSNIPKKQLAGWVFLRWLVQPENEAQWVSANRSFPVRAATLDLLKQSGELSTQWSNAFDSIPFTIHEPPFASWAQIRWAIHDATTQLYRNYFTMDGISPMVDFLQETADDLQKEYDR